MINFRFHVVSLVGVFLALALGVVIGSTVIDRAIVDRLSSQIDSIRKRADEQRAENRALRQQTRTHRLITMCSDKDDGNISTLNR